jgi:hypothetical protein
MRDQLSINGSEGMEREERARLREGLSTLPQPRNEYQIVVPDLPADTGMDDDAMEEDDCGCGDGDDGLGAANTTLQVLHLGRVQASEASLHALRLATHRLHRCWL